MFTVSSIVFTQYHLVKRSFLHYLNRMGKFFVAYPSKFFLALQLFCCRLSVFLLSYDSRSTLIRLGVKVEYCLTLMFTVSSIVFTQYHLVKRSFLHYLYRMGKFFVAYPSKFFLALQSFCCRLSVFLLSYDSRSNLIRLNR